MIKTFSLIQFDYSKNVFMYKELRYNFNLTRRKSAFMGFKLLGKFKC